MMESSYKTHNGNGVTDNGHAVAGKCEIDGSTAEYLTLNHIPLNPDTLLEVNGVRTSIYSDGVSTLLKRDRLDRKSEEATFVSTDSVRMTGSVKFEVFDKDVLLLSGVLDLCNGNGLVGESKYNGQRWNMNCKSDIIAGTNFFKGKQLMDKDSTSPTIEVYIAGSFMGTPIILTKTLQLTSKKKHARKGMLDAIPEYEANENNKDIPSGLALQSPEYLNHKPEDEDYSNLYSGTPYWEGEDGELSWFNSGVRAGVGIGLSICIGIGIGVGLLVQTYQGTTRNFRRQLL
ncbi:Erythronate-4-phosphate dehydrogenase family protein [Quillaja saponaria]|uniref:Erythronate-4-phosphate dehydrogenase family protein n=1 Tax=Quillaja saponaria TaxID=32244 RepID=A0AAD7VJV0_QUISA|nr:Erythronate-4-phosphate dehydrogenase family protein [Quillaja saponaria]